MSLVVIAHSRGGLWAITASLRPDGVSKSRHQGVIWSAPEGDAVFAALAGARCLKSARMADFKLMLMGPVRDPVSNKG